VTLERRVHRAATTSEAGIRDAVDESIRALPGEVAVNVTSLSRRESPAPFPAWLAPPLRRALVELGVRRPWDHQVEAWELLHAGRDVIVATPTASGKTLCYNVPVLDRLIADPSARALYVFPTKALARDQEAAIRLLVSAAGADAPAVVYDGDTPSEVRRAARGEARVLITNPDMLHTGILPHHASWAPFFAGLRHVVVDELHNYRGVFGSHVANVIRRLRRVAAFHGATPSFAACSATIGNPIELAGTVLQSAAALVDRSGAPGGPRTFIVYNPEIVDPVMGLRRSSLRVAARMAGDLVERDVTTLVFCQSRRGVEMTLRYLRDRVAARGGNPDRVRGYRGGYLPALRREIESALREGRLDAVVATNALELGIDVGELDAVVLAGYPGTIAATHQRAGRAGRRSGPSLSVLVARSTPVDQFLVREPSFLLDASPEVALVQPDNLEILIDHIRCAAFEIPFDPGERFGALEAGDTEALLECLADEGQLSRSKGRYHFIGDGYPTAKVSLRSVRLANVLAVDAASGEPIADVDRCAALRELHEDAIYQLEGETYLVEALDLEAGRAMLRAVEPAYFTTPVAHVRLEVLEERSSGPLGEGTAARGDVRVTEEITSFKKTRFGSHENLGYGEISQPPLIMETEAAWIAPSEALCARLDPEALRLGLEGLREALHHMASIRLMCDPRDLASVVQAAAVSEGDDEERGTLAVYLYDAYPGGVGLSDRAFTEAATLVSDTLRMIEGCPCAGGCPSCVGPAAETRLPVKELARLLAAALAGGGVG